MSLYTEAETNHPWGQPDLQQWYLPDRSHLFPECFSWKGWSVHFALRGLGLPYSSQTHYHVRPQPYCSHVQEVLDSQGYVGSSPSSPGPCAFTPEHNGFLSMATSEILLSIAADMRRPSVSGPRMLAHLPLALNKSSLVYLCG